MEQPSLHSDISLLRSIVDGYRPDLATYEEFYRQVHQNPKISGVAQHLRRLGFEVHTGIGAMVWPQYSTTAQGKTIQMGAELDALPILEEADLSYKSTERMINRYGNECPIMHACGHDMNVATLLGASALLEAAAHKWSGTLVIVFQPNKRRLHIVPSKSGTVGIRSGPVLVAADSVNVRVIGGPLCRLSVAMKIISQLKGEVRRKVGLHEDTTVACWGFYAGVPGNDFPAVREKALCVVKRSIEDGCRAGNTLEELVINFTVCVLLTTNGSLVLEAISHVLGYFEVNAVEILFTRACKDFLMLGEKHSIPCAYWNFAGSQTTEESVPTNHSSFFAPAIQPTLKVSDAMALLALTFLAT
ncbi:hypothetical protein EV127DRAFT_458260 [Xylaria flabelliformis]|nr:hypothetical protein EV127DRAFT_458260 [Xylaria flabelliformis]